MILQIFQRLDTKFYVIYGLDELAMRYGLPKYFAEFKTLKQAQNYARQLKANGCSNDKYIESIE